MALANHFLLAYLFFLLFGGWALLCWFASEYLSREEGNLRSRSTRRSRDYHRRRRLHATRKWGMAAVIVLSTCACLILVRSEDTAYELMQLRGILEPADDPIPPNQCSRGGSLPHDAVLLLTGDSSGNATWTDRFPHTVIAYNGKPILTLDRTESGTVEVSVTIFDKGGNLIASIDKGEFNLANHALLTHKPRPDKSTLVVFDEGGEKALYVRYLNKRAIEISGSMYLGGKKRPIDFPGSDFCIGNIGTDMNIVGPRQEEP